MGDMRTNRPRRDPCVGKRRFASAGMARRHMKRLIAAAPECRVYPCKICGGWHFGHIDPAIGRIARMNRVTDAIDKAMGRTKGRA